MVSPGLPDIVSHSSEAGVCLGSLFALLQARLHESCMPVGMVFSTLITLVNHRSDCPATSCLLHQAEARPAKYTSQRPENQSQSFGTWNMTLQAIRPSPLHTTHFASGAATLTFNTCFNLFNTIQNRSQLVEHHETLW